MNHLNSEVSTAEQHLNNSSPQSLPTAYKAQQLFRHFLTHRASLLKTLFLSALFLAYLTYFVYCMIHSFGDENSVRLLVCTILGVLVMCWRVANRVFPDLKKRGGKLVCSGNCMREGRVRRVKLGMKW